MIQRKTRFINHVFSITTKFFREVLPFKGTLSEVIFQIDVWLKLHTDITQSKLLQTGIHYEKLNCIPDLMKQLKRIKLIVPDETQIVDKQPRILWQNLIQFRILINQ